MYIFSCVFRDFILLNNLLFVQVWLILMVLLNVVSNEKWPWYSSERLVNLVQNSGESKMKDYEKKVNLPAVASLRRRSGELLWCFLYQRK